MSLRRQTRRANYGACGSVRFNVPVPASLYRPLTYSDPYGLCPVPADDCPPGYFTLLGTLVGGLGGGLGGGALGLGGGPLAPATVPLLSTAGAVKGAAAGAVVGAAVDGLVLATKGESAFIGKAIEAVMGKASNTRENRQGVGDHGEGCKANGVTGTKNGREDFTFPEMKERVKEFFGVN